MTCLKLILTITLVWMLVMTLETQRITPLTPSRFTVKALKSFPKATANCGKAKLRFGETNREDPCIYIYIYL